MQERNIDYNFQMQSVIDGFLVKPKILMHACCAPCASACVERLKDKADITLFFYNPNMDNFYEFEKRKLEMQKLSKEMDVPLVVIDYDASEYYSRVSGLEKEKEGGIRCEKCFSLRLEKSANFAFEKGFDLFCTTLTVSPLKNAKLINTIGEKVSREVGVKYLPTDFKKKNGYIRSIQLSKQFNFYRQSYCGCAFSLEQAKEQRL